MADNTSTAAMIGESSSVTLSSDLPVATRVSRVDLVAIYVLFAAGGMAALIYEVIWMREFRLVFGSSSQSAAVVLAAFFTGLALGNWIGARLTHRSNLLQVYGFLEIGVGATALLVYVWLALYAHSYAMVYDWLRPTPALLTANKFLLATIALLPPTILMGSTLPVLSQAVADRPDTVARRLGWLYMFNILGAVVGALLAGIYLPIAIGVSRSVFVAAAINWAIGASALLLARLWPMSGQNDFLDKAKAGSESFIPWRRPAFLLIAVAAVSGFGSLALEVICVRILAQRSDGSVYAFAITLSTFLLCLAIGAGIAGRWLDRRSPWLFLASTQLAAVIAILAGTLIYQFLPLYIGVSGDTYAGRTLKMMLVTLLILGPAIAFIGVVLPWTWKLASFHGEIIGHSVGLLTGINTVAAVCGSLLAGFVFLPSLGLGGSTLLVASLYAALAIVGFWHDGSVARRWLGVSACILIPVLWYVGGLWRPIYQPLGPGERIIAYRDTADASIAVLEGPEGHRAIKLNHHYTLGSSSAGDREMRQGRLPLMLHPQPRRVAFIGAATGITSSAALDFPVERVAAIELIPGVAQTMPMFERWNGAFYSDPRVQLIVDDGRNFMMGSREQFDVVVSDLFVPWHAGTGDLYTVDHFNSVRGRLAPGGIFAQWLPLYQLTVDELRAIAASFVRVFPKCILWRDSFHPRLPLVCLVGYRDEIEMLSDHVQRSRQWVGESKRWPDRWLASPGGLELLFVCDDKQLQDWTHGSPLNTDEYPIIEYTTPKSSLEHRQEENLRAILQQLNSFRPRRWSYRQYPTPELEIGDILTAADLLDDAVLAGMRNDFEREFQLLVELGEFAGKLPAVGMLLTQAAARYQSRQMGERGEQVLAAVVKHPTAPAEALVAMAAIRRRARDNKQAAVLLERAVEASPDVTAIRRQLIDVLTEQEQFDRAENHLLHLVNGAPSDAFLRLELARALHRQGKTEDARKQVDEFRARWDGTNGPAVWRYLRTLGLGVYVDTLPLEKSSAAAGEEATSAP